jgi:hypothetical protein
MAFDGRVLSGVSVLAAVVDGGSFVKAAELIGLADSGSLIAPHDRSP